MLDTRLLTFLTFAKIKSYTKAAQLLHITQPAITQHIQFLEEYYGVTLVRKQGRSVFLTEEGELLLQYATQLETISKTMERQLQNKGGVHKRYRVGASRTIGSYIMPYYLGQHKKDHKNIDILLEVDNTKEITEKVFKVELDFALVEGSFDKKEFLHSKLKDDELVLIVSPNHLFAKQKEVTIEEIVKGPLILREEGSGTRRTIIETFSKHGYTEKELKGYMEIGDISAIKSMVEMNLGYTIISKESIKREVELGTVVVVPMEGVRIFREFNFVYTKESPFDFVEHFSNFCKAL